MEGHALLLSLCYNSFSASASPVCCGDVWLSELEHLPLLACHFKTEFIAGFLFEQNKTCLFIVTCQYEWVNSVNLRKNQ